MMPWAKQEAKLQFTKHAFWGAGVRLRVRDMVRIRDMVRVRDMVRI